MVSVPALSNSLLPKVRIFYPICELYKCNICGAMIVHLTEFTTWSASMTLGKNLLITGCTDDCQLPCKANLCLGTTPTSTCSTSNSSFSGHDKGSVGAREASRGIEIVCGHGARRGSSGLCGESLLTHHMLTSVSSWCSVLVFCTPLCLASIGSLSVKTRFFTIL